MQDQKLNAINPFDSPRNMCRGLLRVDTEQCPCTVECINKLAAKPLWLRAIAGVVCFIFVFQQAAYSLNFSELTFDDKNFVEKQGISAAEFLQQTQNEHDYLLRQQKVAAVLNGAAARNGEDLTMNLFGVSFEQFKVADDARKTIEKAQNVAGRAGSGVSGFSYIKYNDGKTAWMKDNLPEKIVNEIVKDKDGHTTLRNTYNMVYNDKRLLISYDADVTDNKGNKTTIDWRNASYTNDSVFYANDDTVANKHLTNYVETVTDQTTGNRVVTTFENPVYDGKNMVSYATLVQDGRSPDKLVENDYSGITYDAQHNMATYTQTIQDTLTLNGNPYQRIYTQTFTGCQYDANKNLTAYTEIVNDEWGQTITNFTGTYNQFSELVSSIKEETFSDGTKSTVKFNGGYDSDSRLMYSTEVTTDSRYPALFTTRNFTAGVDDDYGYNQHGDLTSYTEETIGNDGKITINEWYGAEYDNRAQLLTYQQDITDSLGQTMHKVWRAGENAYNGLNQLSSYEEDTTFGDMVITKKVIGAVYDYLGQLAQINETTTITGVDTLGRSVNYNKTVVRHDATYSAQGQVAGLIEDTNENEFDSAGNVIYALNTRAVDTNVSLAGYTEVKTITGYNYQDVTTTIRTNTQYNSAKQIISYTEKVVGSASPNAYTITTRQDMLYNSLGQLVAYRENVFNSNTPGTGTSQTVTDVYDINYDSLSNVIARTEDSTSVDGIKTNTQISDIQYTGSGKQVSYNQTQTQALSSPVTTTILRDAIQYNKNGLLASYVDTTTSSTDNLTRVTDWQADEYYSSGQLEAYHQTIDTTGADIFGTAVDFSNTIDMLQMSYNTSGLMVSSYEEDSSSSAPEVVTTKNTTGMSYDDYGQLAEFIEDKWDVDNADPTLLDLHTVTTRYDSNFQNGRLFGYTENVQTTSDNADLDTSTATVRTNIGYDDYGRMNFYNDQIIASAAPDKTSYVTWQGLAFDAAGAVLSYQQTTHDLGVGLDVTTALTRSNIIYNSLQQVISYNDEIDSSASPQKTSTMTRTKTSYNALGQVSAYSEQDKDIFIASGFVNENDVDRYAMQYNLLNQLTGYNETTQSSLTPQIMTTTTWSSLGYDINGNLAGYNQRDQQTNDSGTLDLDNTTVKENILYNGLGQAQSYKQTTIQSFPGTNESPATSVEQVTAVSYDSNGQILQSTETTDDGYTQTADTRSGMDYNAQGFLDAYTDTIHQTNNNGLVADTKSTWSALDFYDNGRVKDYQQTTQGQSSAGTQTLQQNDAVTRSNIVYDDNGFTLSYDETDTSLSDRVTSTWQAKAYDCFGRVLAYTQSGQNSSSGPFSLTRSAIEYSTINNVNRVISYAESGSAAGNIYNKTWAAGTLDGTGATYDAKGNLVNYYEEGFDTNRGAYTLSQTDATYNAFGEVLTYIEEVTNANGGLTNTVRDTTDYNDLGQAQYYHQTKTNPDGSQIITTWQNPAYDSLSRLTAYDQIDFMPDINQTTTTHWQANFADSYLPDGFLNHYTTTKDSSDAAVAFSTHTVTDWKALNVNNAFQAAAYQETVTTTGQVTTTSDPDYALLTDAQSQAYQNALATNQIFSTVTTTRTNISYDNNGLVLSYTDNIAQDNGSASKIDWQASGYDSNGLLLGYTQNVTVSGDNLSQQYTVTRTIADYDASLLPKDYTDVETNSGVVTTTLMNDVTYDSFGREATYTKSVTDHAQGNGTQFDYTTTTQRLNTDYCGSYVTDYAEEAASDLDAITTAIHVFGIVYDSHGNQTSYITRTHRVGTSTQNAYFIGNDPVTSDELTQALTANPGIDLSTVFTVKQLPFSLDDWTISVSYGLVYNGINQLTSDNEAEFDETNNLSTLTTESNILYNDKNQRISYNTTTHQQGITQTVSYAAPQGAALTADALKNLLNANPDKTIDDLLNQGTLTRTTQTAAIDNQRTVDRTNILYNNFGQVISYDDLTITPGTTAKSQVTNITYDDKNRQAGYTATTYNRNDNQPNADFVFSNTVTRASQLYNDLGQVLSYCDTTVTPSLGGNITKVDNFSFQYNNAGQIALQIDDSYYSGYGLHTVYSYNNTPLTAQVLSDLEAANPGKTLVDLVNSGVITQSQQAFDSGALPATTTVRFDFTYNAAGQAVGYTDLSAVTGIEGYDLANTSDIVYTPDGDTAFSRRQETAIDSDGQQNTSDTLTFRDYNNTLLTNVADIATSSNSDGYFYQGVSRTYNDYAIVYNQAQLTTATTNTTYTNFAPASGNTSGTVTQTTTYGYDSNGQLNAMRATSGSSDIDTSGNQNNSTTFEIYDIVNGAGKLALSETSSNAANVDLSTSQAITCTVYSYNDAGKLAQAQGVSDSTSNDGFGNGSTSHTVQDYTIILDKAKLLKATTTSNAANYDGSFSTSQMVTDYTYDDKGKLQTAIANGTSDANDGLGNLQNSTVTQHYFIFADSAVLSDTINATHTQDLDNSSSDSTITTTYNYDKSSAKWALTGATASGTSTSNDGCASSASLGGYGNITTSTITQNFTAITGQARMVENDTVSTTQNLDGSSVDSITDLTYQYNPNGTLHDASSIGNSTSNDGSGNMNYSLTNSDYAIIAGQAKVAQTYNRSNSVGTDLSNSLSCAQTHYAYNHGQLVSVTPVLTGNWGTTYSYQGSALLGATFDNNSFDTAFNALAADFSGKTLPDSLDSLSQIVTTSQSYQLYAGKNYLTQSITDNQTINPDGSTSDTASSMDYTYIGATLDSAYGSSNGTSNDGCASSASLGGFGNITTRTSNDDYVIIGNQAKLLSSSSSAQTQNLDGSTNSSDTDTFYSYDGNGILTKAWGNGTSTSNDGFGNLSNSTITQSYQIIANRARLLTSTAASDSINLDGSLSHSDITTTYNYDSNGILTGCTGLGTSSSGDISGNSTSAGITQYYHIIHGSAKLYQSTTVTQAQGDYEFTASQTNASTFYNYDEGGKLTGAYSDESASGFDQYDNSYTQSVHRDYVLQYGQLRQAKAVTVKDTTGSGWTQHTEDTWVAGDGKSSALSAYDGHGKLLQYHETTQETGAGTQAKLNTTVTVDWSAVGYTVTGGWLTGYSQTQSVTGTNENGDPYNLTTTDTRSNISYYGAGEKYQQGLVKGYEEVTASSDAANKSNYQKVENITYDNFYNAVTNKTAQNRQSSEDILVTTTDTKGTLDTSDDTVIDPTAVDKTIDSYDSYDLADSWVEIDSDTSGNKQTQTTTTSVYDALGHVVSSNSLVNEKSISDNGASLNQSYELDKTNIQYDALGEATSWTQTITNQSDASGLTTQSTITASYDALGRLTYYSETGTKQDATGTVYNESYSLVRNNFVYDDLDQAIAWHEVSTSSSAPDKLVDSDVTTTYLSDGNIGTQSRDTTETVQDGANLISQKKYNLTVTYSNYDSLNRAGTTQTVTTNSDTSSTTIVETGDQYNQAGQKIAYTEDVTETFPGLPTRNYAKTTVITKFDDYGQVLEKTETTVEGAKTTVRATDKDISYDLTGNILEEEDMVTESGSDQYGALDRVTLSDNIFAYDPYGRIQTTTSTISTQKSAGAPFKEASYSVTTNLGFDAHGRANNFITDDYSAIDSTTNQRTLLDYTETEVTNFNGAGQVLNETVGRYSFDDQLLQFDVVSNNSFDAFGNANDVITTSYSTPDTTLAPMSSQQVLSTYDAFGRVTDETRIFSLGGNPCQRTITTNTQFDKNSQVLASTIKEDTYNSGWQLSSVTVKNAQEDSLNNITDETVKVYSDAAQTQFQGGWVTHNYYSNSAAAALGNYTQSTTAWDNDATLSQTVLKKSITINSFADNANPGFITQSVTTVYDASNSPVSCNITANSNFNSDGYAKNVTITDQIYDNGAFQTSQSTNQVNTLFDRQGRVLLQTIIDKTAVGLVKSSSTHTNYYFSGGELELVQNFLPDGTLQDKEIIRSSAMNAEGKPLTSTIMTYNPDGSTLDEKTVYSTYDALDNAITQNTFVNEPNSAGSLAPALQIDRTNSNFDIFGLAHDTSTITSDYDGATGKYDTVNQITTHTGNFNAQGNAFDQTSCTYLPDNANWDLAVKAVTDNTYDSTGRLTQSVVDKYDASNVEWQETVTGNTAFDPYDNPNAQTITVSTRDGSTGQFLPSEQTTRTITTNSLGWELSYAEDTVSLSGSLVKTHVDYSAVSGSGVPYMNARGQPTQYTETTRTYSDDGAYDVTTKTTRAISGYDALGQMTGYTDTITSHATADLTTTQNYANIVYDGLGNMDSYTLIDTQTGDNLNSQTTTRRTATNYDVLGRAIYYQETDTSNADSVSDQLTMNNVVYDFNNNMVSYIQTEHKTGIDPITGDTLDTTDTTTRTLNGNLSAFDQYNRVNAYVDTVEHTAANSNLDYTETAHRQVSNYNTLGQLAGYIEDDYSTVTQNLVCTHIVMGSLAPDKQSISYNGLGQMYSYQQLENQYDPATGGTALKIDTTTWRTWSGYDQFGRLTAYTDNAVVEDLANPTAFCINQTTNRIETSYNEFGLVNGYTETFASNAAPDLTTTTQMSDIRYTSAGQMDSYIQAVTNANNPGTPLALDVTDTTTRISTIYNNLSQASAYDEISTSTATPDLQTQDGMSSCAYDAFNRLVSYVRWETQTDKPTNGQNLDVITCTNRFSTAYNKYNQITDYYDQTGTVGSLLYTDAHSDNMLYDMVGNPTTYTRTERQYGFVDSTYSALALDTTTVINRTWSSCNLLGQMAAYTENAVSSATPGLTTTTMMSGITYDPQGQMATYVSTEHQISTADPSVATDVSLPATANLSLNYGEVDLMNETIDEYLTGLYVGTVRVGDVDIAINEQVVSGVAPGSNDYANHTVNGWVYDGATGSFYKNFSGIVSGDRTLKYLKLSNIVCDGFWFGGGGFDGDYDYYSHVSFLRELASSGTYAQNCDQAKVDIKGGQLNTDSTLIRQSTSYNSLGQVVNRCEITNSSATPDLTSTIALSNIAYNPKGQMYSYIQTEHDQSTATTTFVETIDLLNNLNFQWWCYSYNPVGSSDPSDTIYLDYISNIVLPDVLGNLPVVVNGVLQPGWVYDQANQCFYTNTPITLPNGLTLNSLKLDISSIGAYEGPFDIAAMPSSYTSGSANGYSFPVTMSAVGQPINSTAVSTRTSTTYNSLGQVAYSYDTINDGGVNHDLTQSDVAYTQFGAATTGQITPLYNSKGQLTDYYTSTGYISGASSQDHKINIAYNASDKINTFSEVSLNKTGITTSANRTASVYDPKGQLKFSVDNGQAQVSIGSAMYNFTSTKNFSYANSYNSAGQLVYYSENGNRYFTDTSTYSDYADINNLIYDGQKAPLLQSQAETVGSHTNYSITFSNYDAYERLTQTNEFANGPAGTYRTITYYNTAIDRPVSSITTGLDSSRRLYNSTTAYNYTSIGQITSSNSVTHQSGLVITSTTTYNSDNTQTVIANTTGKTDEGYNIIKNTTTQIDANGKNSSITGTEEAWGNQGKVSWRKWGNITMDSAGQESANWYREEVNAPKQRNWVGRIFYYIFMGWMGGALEISQKANPGLLWAFELMGFQTVTNPMTQWASIAKFNPEFQKWLDDTVQHGKEWFAKNGAIILQIILSCIPGLQGIGAFIGNIVGNFIGNLLGNTIGKLVGGFVATVVARVVVAVIVNVVVQLAITGMVNGNQLGMSAAMAGITAGVGCTLGGLNIDLGPVANAVTSAVKNVVSFIPVGIGALLNFAISTLGSIIGMISEFFSQIDSLYMGMNTNVVSAISELKSQIVSLISDQISKAAKSKFVGMMLQLIASMSSRYASSYNDIRVVGETSSASMTLPDWNQYAQSEFLAEVVKFGVVEAIDSSGIKNSYALAAIGGFENALSKRFPAYYGYDTNEAIPSSDAASFAPDGAKDTQTQLVQGLQETGFGKSVDQFQGEADATVGYEEGYLHASIEDAKAELNGISSDLKPESFDELKQYTVSTNSFMLQEASSAMQLAESNKFTEEKTLLREMSTALLEGKQLKMEGYSLSHDGLTIEVQVKVGDLNANIQAALKTAGLLPENQVTLVKDLIKNEMYIKFDMDSSHIENYMGKEFMQQLGGLVDVSNLKTNIVDGTLQGKLYLDNKGNVIDRGISFQMKVDGLVDAQAKAAAKAFGAETVSLDLRQSGKGTMTLTSKLNANEIIKNLGEQGLGKMADTLAKSIGGQVLDLAKVSSVTMALNIAKVGGQLRTINVDKVEYAVGVDNLRGDSKFKAIATALGITDLTLTTDLSKEGHGQTFISAMRVNGENINDSTIALVMEKDKDLGNMLKSIQARVMQNGIIDPAKVNFEIKNAVNYQGKIITTIAMSTPFDNIKPGSGLDIALSGRASLSNQGMAYFAMTSLNPGEIVVLKNPANGVGANNHSPVEADRGNTKPIAAPSARNDAWPKPPSSSDLRMDITPGIKDIHPGFGSPTFPLAPTAFFYNEMAGLGEFYQAFDTARSMSTPNSFAQNLSDVLAARGGAQSVIASEAKQSQPAAANPDFIADVRGFFAQTGKSVGEFADGAISLCKIDNQTTKYYGNNISQWARDMGEGGGMAGVQVRDEGDRVVNKMLCYGHYTSKELAVDKAIALDCAKNEKLDGALVFAVGKGAIQSVTRFGEISTIGEHKADLLALIVLPKVTLCYYLGRYIGGALFNNDVVPHHVGQIKTEIMPDGGFVNYVMQINPEGRTKVTMEQFAKDNIDIKIIMPDNGGQDAAKIWSSQFSRNLSTGGYTSDVKMSYDFLRLTGWGFGSDRFAGNKTICSEDVYGKMVAWADSVKLRPGYENIKINPLPGVKVDNRITPWDEYNARDQWDRDKVQEYKINNSDRVKQIEAEINRSYK